MKKLLTFVIILISFANSIDIKSTKPDFGLLGEYAVSSKISPSNENMKFHYSPNKLKNVPVVIYCSAGNSFSNAKLMNFIASQGYFVVEAKQRNNARKYVSMMKEIHSNYNVDTSKVVLLGYSLGGSYIYEILRSLKSNNYAQTKSGLVSLDGFFAKDMNAEEMDNLKTEALLLMFGGVDGTPSKDGKHISYQDPRIFLTLYKLLEKHNKVSLYPVEANDTHWYVGGDANSVKEYVSARQDILKPIHAFLHHILTYKNGVNYGKDMVMIGDSKYDEISSKLLDEKDYQYKCKTKYFGGLNYCSPSHPTF